MKALISSQPCRERVTHFNPHPDEGLGFFLGLRFGREIFQGIETAPLVLLNAGQRPPDGAKVERYESTRFVVGTCLGRYDEHGLSEEARKTYAAASLVARDLGCTEDPALKPVLEYTVQNDRHAHRSTWDLASIMFAINVLLKKPTDAQITLDFAYDWFDVAYDFFALRIAQGEEPKRPKGELSLNDYILTWLINEFDNDGVVNPGTDRTVTSVAEALGLTTRREFKRILALAERDNNAGAATDFDIFTFVEMAVAVGKSTDWIYERLALMFNARLNEDTLFHQVLDSLPQSASFIQIWRNPANPDRPMITASTPANRSKVEQVWRDEKKHKLMFTIGAVTSDCPVAHKAFRYTFQMDVMVIRKSNGYVAVNVGRLPRGPFAYRFRTKEAGSRYMLTNDEKTRDGNLYGPDGRQLEWCNFKEGGWLLNGAFTVLDQDQLPPTRLSVTQQNELIMEALYYIDGLRRSDSKKRKPTSKYRSPEWERTTTQGEPPLHMPKGFSNTPRVKA